MNDWNPADYPGSNGFLASGCERFIDAHVIYCVLRQFRKMVAALYAERQ